MRKEVRLMSSRGGNKKDPEKEKRVEKIGLYWMRGKKKVSQSEFPFHIPLSGFCFAFPFHFQHICDAIHVPGASCVLLSQHPFALVLQ